MCFGNFRWPKAGLLRYILLTYLLVRLFPAVAENSHQKYILVISSYSEKTEWAALVGNRIVTELKAKYPDILVTIEYLGADNTSTRNGLLGKMRGIFQSAHPNKQKESQALSDLSVRSVFRENDSCKPAVLVFIGDEIWGLYRDCMDILGSWDRIPVVLCGVNDSLADNMYYPQSGARFTPMVSITESAGMFFPEEKISLSLGVTGVVHRLPLRKNLELIRAMVPDLKEIVFTDERYYATEYVVRELKKEIARFDPDLRFSVRYTNWINSDSLLQTILRPAEGTAFLTYSWNLESVYSRYSQAQIDSLFLHSRTPLFSLTPGTLQNNKILGGCYYPVKEYVVPVMDILARLLSGTAVKDIPFRQVAGEKVFLNQTNVGKCGLDTRHPLLQQAVRVNIPPGFFKKNERPLLYLVILLSVAGGLLVFTVRRKKHMRQLQWSSAKYKELSEELESIYAVLPMTFAVYDTEGKRRELTGEVASLGPEISKAVLLPEELFRSSCLTEADKDIICSGKVLNREINFNSPERENRYNSVGRTAFQLIVKPLEQKNYDFSGYIAIVVNKTREMQEKTERERVESLFHFASDYTNIGIACYNPFTGKGFANASWYSNLNEKPREMIFPDYGNVFPDDRDILLFYAEQMKTQNSPVCSADIRVLSEDGKIHWIRQFFFQYGAASGTKETLLVELNFNVDEQKESENELRKAKEQAETANKEKEKFLENISHEIRTPLNAIVGFSSVLANRTQTDFGDAAEIIYKNSDILLHLINDILDLSKIDAGKAVFHFSDIALNELMEEVIARTVRKITNPDVRLLWEEKEENPVLHTDPERLKQVLTHLLTNAVKFTDNGEIYTGYRSSGKFYYFYVKDTGCGIEKEKLGDIFGRFVKVDSFTQGSGLGLSLCKSIVGYLGGEIGVNSEQGSGSTFWFTLPRL